MSKIKLLITLAHYLPGTKVGGPVSSIKNIAERLSNMYDIYIITSDREFNSDKPYPNIVTGEWLPINDYKVFYVRRGITTVFQIIKQIRIVGPDIIYLNPFFDPIFSGSVALVNYIKIIKPKKIIIAPRGELFDISLAFKKRKKEIFLKVIKLLGVYNKTDWHATSEEEAIAIRKVLNVAVDRIYIARVIPEKWSDNEINETFYLSTSNCLKIIYLARIAKDKNTPFCFEILNEVTLEVVFDIYGPIEDIEVWNECQKLAKELPENIHFSYKGVVSKNIVKNTLAQYDLFFLPTFSENYGHSIAESLSVGTPVLVSDNTPWRKLEEQGLGWDISLSNRSLFIDVIMGFGNRKANNLKDNRIKIKQKAKKILDNPDIFAENIRLFNT